MKPLIYSGMFFAFLLAFLALFRSDGLPTITNIEEGYRNVTAQNLTAAAAQYGSEDNIPPVIKGLITIPVRVEDPHCEKNPADLGFVCRYTLIMKNTGTTVLGPIPDIKARVYQGSIGWMVHEISDPT